MALLPAPALVRDRCGVALTVMRFIVQSDGVAPGTGEELVSGDWTKSSMSAPELPPGLVVARGSISPVRAWSN